MNRLTIACPANHMDIVNNYAMALSYSEADGPNLTTNQITQAERWMAKRT